MRWWHGPRPAEASFAASGRPGLGLRSAVPSIFCLPPPPFAGRPFSRVGLSPSRWQNPELRPRPAVSLASRPLSSTTSSKLKQPPADLSSVRGPAPPSLWNEPESPRPPYLSPSLAPHIQDIAAPCPLSPAIPHASWPPLHPTVRAPGSLHPTHTFDHPSVWSCLSPVRSPAMASPRSG